MSTIGVAIVCYVESARRHFQDAGVLLTSGRQANAGQLFGFAAECGLKAILIACGAPVDADGSIDKPTGAKGRPFKVHMPELHQAANTLGPLLGDGRIAASYLAAMPSLTLFADWHVDHRYWRDSALPAGSVGSWQHAAREVMTALDAAMQNKGP